MPARAWVRRGSGSAVGAGMRSGDKRGFEHLEGWNGPDGAVVEGVSAGMEADSEVEPLDGVGGWVVTAPTLGLALPRCPADTAAMQARPSSRNQ